MVGWHHRLNGHECAQTPGIGDGQGGLAGCSPWGLKEADTTATEPNRKELIDSCQHYVTIHIFPERLSCLHKVTQRMNSRARIWTGSEASLVLEPPKTAGVWLDVRPKLTVGKGISQTPEGLVKNERLWLENNGKSLKGFWRLGVGNGGVSWSKLKFQKIPLAAESWGWEQTEAWGLVVILPR